MGRQKEGSKKSNRLPHKKAFEGKPHSGYSNTFDAPQKTKRKLRKAQDRRLATWHVVHRISLE